MTMEQSTLLASQNQQGFFQKIVFTAKSNYPNFSIVSVFSRFFYMAVAYKHKTDIQTFIARLSSLPNNQSVKVTPKMLGVVEWPYIHNQWDASTKLDKIATHYEILAKINSTLMQVDSVNGFELADLSSVSEDVRIVIDKAEWFTREGELLLNIFRNNLRVASIAFGLDYKDAAIVAYIGAIQGVHSGIGSDDSLEIFKLLTKDFEGLRPRSLLLEALKVLLKKLGASHIYAISERHRHHRHPYFGNNQNTVFKNDYNQIWEEHGGILNKRIGFYEITLAPAIKPMEEIPSKKRSAYKRRHEIILSLREKLKVESLTVFKAISEPVSAKNPDWSREYKSFFAWDPSRALLASIRNYQSLASSKNPIKQLLKKIAVVRHVFWSVITGADIPLNVQIAGGLSLPHANGVVIHSDAKIGPNCVIFQQVTIGTRDDSRAPVIGGHVDIGAGARIIGNVYIGNHAKIGANAVVLTDVPAGKTAVGIPARII